MSRILIISDTHIGDPRFTDSMKIEKILENEIYDRLILNGDIVDLWLEDINNIIESSLFKAFKRISTIKEVIWVLGNHDYEIYKNNEIISGFNIVGSLEINENQKHILVLHGHQVYSNNNTSWVSKTCTKLNAFIWRHFCFDLQKWFNSLFVVERYAQHKRRLIIKKFGKNKVNAIIIGHTHCVAYCSDYGVELYDLGSAVLNSSYGIVDNGSILIKVE